MFWVHAGDKALFERSYLDISKLQTGTEVEKDENVFVKVSDWLSDQRNGWWLMVLDNADNPDIFYETQSVQSSWGSKSRSYEKPLIDFIPQVSHGKVLVTSRDRRCARRLVDEDNNLIKVDSMSIKQSCRLLRSRIPGSSSDDERCSDSESRILRLLHYIPLAISQAGAYIANCEMTTEEYVKMLKEEEASSTQEDEALSMQMLQYDEGDLRREQALSDLTTPQEQKSRHAVLYTWRISFRRMEHRHPDTARLFSIMVLFHNENIPKYLLHETREEAQLELLLEPILDLGLATINLDGHIDVHRLVHLATRDWLTLKGAISDLRVSAIEIMLERYPNGSVFADWPKCRQLYNHAQEVMAIQQDRGLTYGKLLHSLAQYLSSRGNMGWAHLYAKSALDIVKEFLGEDDIETLKCKMLLATIAGHFDNFDIAEELQQEVLDVTSARMLDETYRNLLPDVASDLTHTYLRLGYYEAGEKLASVLKGLCERMYGPKSPRTRSSVALLASAYREAGKWKEAEEAFRKLVDAERANSAADHPQRFIRLSSLANIIAHRGRDSEAEKLHKESLVGCELALGAYHIHTLTCLADYATQLLSTEKDRDSEAACNEILTRCNSIGLPSWHDLVLSAKSNLATILMHREEWSEAERMFRDIVKKKEEHWEPKHLSILHAKVKLATLYNNKGNFKESEIQLRALLKEDNVRKRASHHLVLYAKMQLAVVIGNQGRFRKAIKMGREIEEVYLKQYGSEDLLTKRAGDQRRKWEECRDSIPSFFWPWSK